MHIYITNIYPCAHIEIKESCLLIIQAFWSLCSLLSWVSLFVRHHNGESSCNALCITPSTYANNTQSMPLKEKGRIKGMLQDKVGCRAFKDGVYYIIAPTNDTNKSMKWGRTKLSNKGYVTRNLLYSKFQHVRVFTRKTLNVLFLFFISTR